MSAISEFYNEYIESACVRVLYFFNSINTYFIVAGGISFIVVFHGPVNMAVLLAALLFALTTAKISDFYPTFPIMAAPWLVTLAIAIDMPLVLLTKMLMLNTALFFIIQFTFMGVPESLVARDIKVPFIKMYNSLFTVSPTTVSFSMSIFFSFYLSFCMASALSCRSWAHYMWLAGAGFILLAVSFISRLMLPKNLFSKFHKPDIKNNPIFERVIILNIDGVRKDIFDSLNLPTISKLTREGASHPVGLETVYKALTNPAFASILTGTTPKFHGIHNNNYAQSIKTEGLPDIVSSIAYGSMHVKHFCKTNWETRIVSLPRHSAYFCDDVMVGWLKDDLHSRPEVRLFIADFSEADFLAHAYGSKSRQYKEALRKIDKRIGDLINWMSDANILEKTAIIVCSDHGVAAIDHSYLIAKSEKYVPFLIYGKGIKKGFKIRRPGKIMDICCTVAYLLGIRYPLGSRGQVFTEVLEGSDLESEVELFVTRFNQLKYDAEAERYGREHVEIYDGDAAWWDQCISRYADDGKVPLRVLDIGCGNGFVGERFIASGSILKEFVCADISSNMLNEAKKRLERYPAFSFTTDLGALKGAFDIVAVSSVFHHVAHPERLARTIDSFLAKGGIVIGSHEPNRAAFENKLFSIGAVLYKTMGLGVSIDEETVSRFNALLRKNFPNAPRVCREEILQMVESHSPLEQYDKEIDLQNGFTPREFCESYFPGYQTLAVDTYSTFYHRPWLTKHRALQSLLAFTFRISFREGNLFRFVLRKT